MNVSVALLGALVVLSSMLAWADGRTWVSEEFLARLGPEPTVEFAPAGSY